MNEPTEKIKAKITELENRVIELEKRRVTNDGLRVIEWDDMTDEQKRIIEAGKTIAGTFPSGLSKEALSAWIMQKFCLRSEADIN